MCDFELSDKSVILILKLSYKYELILRNKYKLIVLMEEEKNHYADE